MRCESESLKKSLSHKEIAMNQLKNHSTRENQKEAIPP
mgnify:CR=1 FL=1